MANVIDIIVSKQAQAELDKVIASLKLTHEEIIKINQQGLKINSGASPKNPQQMNTSVKETIALNEKLDATNKKLLVTAKQMEQQSIKESNARNSLNNQRERSLNQLAKEQQKIAQLSNYYNKTQQQLNTIQQAYNNLAVKKERYNNLSSFEENRLKTLQMLTEKYNGTLKTVDATIGKHTRNVGNYASGFNPLNNSIAQLGREMPAFANSVQTGFMAISNNLPIFFDAMQGVINQNKELQAQGKPTTSALMQLASAFFSFQTLLSVGVTLLTVYGKEIVNFISGSENKKKAIEAEKKAIEEKQKVEEEARQTTASFQSDELSRSKILFENAKNLSLSYKDRLKAVTELKNRYPDYLKNLSNEQILAGQTADAEERLNTALIGRGYALAAQQLLQANIEKELALRLKNATNEEKLLADQQEMFKRGANDIIVYTDRKKQAEQQKESFAKQARKAQSDAYREQIRELRGEREAIMLQYNEYAKYLGVVNETTEAKGKLKKVNEELANFLAREYELRKKILENGIANNKLIADNEKNTLSERIDAYQLYMSLKEQLVQAEFDEQNRIIDTEYKNQINTINDAYSEQIKAINKGVIDGGTKRIQAESEKNEALKALEKKYFFDRQINYTEFEQKSKEIRETYSKDEELALISKYARLDQINENQLAKLNALRNRNFTGGTLTQETPLSSFKSYYDEKGKIEEDARVKSLNADLAINKTKLQSLTFNNKTESEEYKKLTAEKIALELQLQEIKDANTEKEKKKLEEFKKLLKETFDGFINDFGNTSGFGKMIDILNGGLDKFEGNAKAVALSVSDAFQEAYNTISERSQANFDAEYLRLERQKEFAIMFAGESSTAKEEIERQYEERKRAIARREAEAQKRLAIFNIAIDTAQAVVAALPNIPLSIVMGVLGAAQIAMVSSQQIPQFWKGTDNAPEGLAWTQEKGAEVITDKKGNVKTFGNNKGAQLTYLEKGDKVYKSQQDYINKTLVGAGIQPMRENNSLTSSDFNNGISKLAKTMQSNKGSNTQVFLNNKQINTDYFKGQRV